MPIRPENVARYPVDWKDIRTRILARAKDRCEKCRARNYSWISRSNDGESYMEMDGDVIDAETGERIGRARGSEWNGKELVRVVLTVAHLDHTPENCDLDNLRAWCQRCHNRYDNAMRRRGIQDRAKATRAVGDLFPPPPAGQT